MHTEIFGLVWITVDKFCDKTTKERLFVDKCPDFIQKSVHKEQIIHPKEKFSTKTRVLKGFEKACFGIVIHRKSPLFARLIPEIRENAFLSTKDL